jgi:3'-phosphoadenosine 5'-phosphosulfate (PAPS) 3'-phosphatase
VIDVQPENWLGELLLPEVAIAPEASQPIMTVDSGLVMALGSKRHASPLARAGLASHHLILNSFALLSPNLQVLTQESSKVPFDQQKTCVMGNSPKFCPVVEGYSDLCPALTETMDGNPLAAHCILEQALACCRLGWQFHEVQQTLTAKLRHPAHGSVETIRSHPEANVGCLRGRSKEAG